MPNTFHYAPHAFNLPLYGTEPGKELESFPSYLARVFLPVLHNMPELHQIRCSISGFVTSRLTHEEVVACFKATCIKLNLNRYDTLLDLPSKERVIEVCETIEDEIKIRLAMMARPAPSLIKNDGQFVIQDLDPNRQLAILVSQFLWDTGLYRANKNSDDVILHLQRTFDLADLIQATQASTTEDGMECLATLIELDAKYRITELRLSRKESDRLIAIREKAQTSFKEIKQFALQLLIQREKQMSPEIMPARWTQLAYRNQVFQAVSREDKSNLMEGIRKAAMPSNAHIKTPVHPSTSHKPATAAKPKTEKQQAAADMKARISAMLKGTMSGFNI